MHIFTTFGGNITTKKEYAYTTQSDLTNLTPTNTINYTYGNNNWKDQLTSYNGNAITYDAIGNPTSYNGNTYTWQNGRELATLTNTSQNLSISYKYDDAGIRTQKTVNGTVTNYFLEGANVIYEKTGNDLTYYSYDEVGQIIGMNRNGTQYFYIHNLQGDIIGLLDDTLQQVVGYVYNSWGVPISITDGNGNDVSNNASHIANINPYRYRRLQIRYGNSDSIIYKVDIIVQSSEDLSMLMDLYQIQVLDC